MKKITTFVNKLIGVSGFLQTEIIPFEPDTGNTAAGNKKKWLFHISPCRLLTDI